MDRAVDNRIPIRVPVYVKNGVPRPISVLTDQEGKYLTHGGFLEIVATDDLEVKFEEVSENEPSLIKVKLEEETIGTSVIIKTDEDIYIDPQEELVETYSVTEQEFSVGDKFDSYEAFYDRLQIYKTQNNVEFVKRDARTIESAMKRITSRTFRKELQFYEVNMRCVYGGRVVSRAKTNRQSRDSLKMGCPAFMSLRATSDGCFLEIRSLKLDHNHPLDPIPIKQHLTTKRMPKKLREKAQLMLATNVDKNAIGEMIAKEFGEVDAKRVVNNLQALISKSEKQTVLNRIFLRLRKQNDGVIDYFPEKYELKGILFQDQEMRNFLYSFPEIVTVVEVGRTKERASCYIFIAEDSNGLCEMVAFGVLVSDKDPNFSNLLELFRVRNADLADRMKIIVCDKDENVVDQVKPLFPHAICFLTKQCVSKNLRKYSTTARLTEQQTQAVMSWVDSVFSVTEDAEYSSLYSKLSDMSPRFLDLYNGKWHSIIPNWALGLSFRSAKFMPLTFVAVEDIVNQLNSVKSCPPEAMIDQIFRCSNELRKTRQVKAASIALSSTIEKAWGSFEDVLTPYACTYIEAQMKIPEIELLETNSSETFQADTWEGLVTVTAISCTCNFHRHMSLPCCHILACRHYLNLDFFDETLYDKRWTLEYYKSTFKHFEEVNDTFNFVNGEWVCREGTSKDEMVEINAEEEDNIFMDDVTVVDLGDVETSA
ncbi:uncharacterized protein LOC136027308 isoform X2 [Artemia franciscana]|uniref:uncharacterized protein LOC136027308 isoform X2 n=1 Tax=Artemia franciscana TaxID=6661 RepID=UPI0032D9C251